nr:hypothetical protein BaRGS_016984 [Batillaria attramentaria]
MASAEDQKAFEDLVASSAIPTQLGDINKEDLPGPEALLNPGRKEGQTKMVRQGDHVELYSWDTAEGRWTKIGDVVGSSGGTQASSGKTLFEGKEYDYVFDVDIEEGKPPLKLPYNITEDPWFAAQAFIHRYNLSQLFLDQVANFITQNAKGVTLGAGSYRPGGNSTNAAPVGNSYFPVTTFLTMDNVNPKQIISKLGEFNKAVPADKQVDAAALNDLEKLLSDKVFPALDILRIGVKYAPVCHHFCQQEGFLDFICKYLSPGNLAPNQMLALRMIANLFVQPEGVKLLLSNQSQVLQSVLLCEGVTTKNAQIALSTAIINFSIAATAGKNFDQKSECAAAAAQLLKKEFDSEAVFRLLVALGTLVHGDEGCLGVVQSLDVAPALTKIREKSDLNKVIECADLLLKL